MSFSSLSQPKMYLRLMPFDSQPERLQIEVVTLEKLSTSAKWQLRMFAKQELMQFKDLKY
jgi:hypothetical protein